MQQPADTSTRPVAVLADGTPNFGAHTTRLDPIDLTSLLSIDSSPLSIRRYREKRWCYIGVIHPQVILGCAVIHLGYVSSAFAFAFDRESRKMVEHNMVSPPLGQVSFDRHPDQGTCSFRAFRGRVAIFHDISTGIRLLTTDLFFPGHSLSARITVDDKPDDLSPLQVITPMENGQTVFTHKAAGMPAHGRITVNGKTVELRPEETRAIFDWTDGFHNRNTFWNWACGAGDSDEGRRIGFNFSAGVYESGVLENVIWIDGRPVRIGRVDFDYDTQKPQSPWRVRSRGGEVDLTFQPEGIRGAKQNLGIIASRFIQPCGSYSGTIRDPEGQTLNLTSVGGVVEEHFARW